jgi:drug/metabolite transporter (DMT)-like permease
MKPKHWIAYILLGLIWSTSFLWIKIAVQEIGPFTLVAFRVLFGLLTAGGAALLTRAAWPRDRGTWLTYVILGLTSVAIPFLLITWAEQFIDSAIASILNATVPLFTILIAHYSLHDDRMNLFKIFGILTGFAGVAILLSEDLTAGTHNSIIGQAAVVLAAVFYAGSSVYARRTTEHVPGLVRGAAPFISAVAVMWIAAPAIERPFAIPQLPLTWVALLWLGALGSGLALVLWYYLLHEIGPTRTSSVSYIFPLGGVILGVLFLQEQLSWQLVVGALFIISGVLVTNWNPREQKQIMESGTENE